MKSEDKLYISEWDKTRCGFCGIEKAGIIYEEEDGGFVHKKCYEDSMCGENPNEISFIGCDQKKSFISDSLSVRIKLSKKVYHDPKKNYEGFGSLKRRKWEKKNN